MRIITNINEMAEVSAAWTSAGERIAVVPTMGFLHDGHLSLINKAGAIAGKVVVTIFVNPAQFGPNEDFQKYPRDSKRDYRLCAEAGVDLVFHPTPPDAMYAADHSVWVTEEALAAGMCGASRPGHFRGVLTVVLKLFNLVRPQIAVFGQKDAQQVRLIQRMTRDLNIATRIVIAPIIREPDGLALSSRNTYLNVVERGDALCLVRALQKARQLYRDGERDAESIQKAMVAEIQATPSAMLDYAVIVDDKTLAPVTIINQPVLLALAVRIGKTRLIDNLMLPDDILCAIPEP